MDEKKSTKDVSFQAELIIEGLNEYETLIVTELGRLKISVNKNVSEETLKKKLPDDHLKHFSRSIRNLKSNGLIVKYRNENWGVSQIGRIVARKLVEKYRAKKYKKQNLRIMALLNIK
ncbi:MAG: hypothetical protein FWH29_04640 [Methanobrevibacter sp.]|nr:hypothetical protein [Methanobrevibacter sp.]